MDTKTLISSEKNPFAAKQVYHINSAMAEMDGLAVIPPEFQSTAFKEMIRLCNNRIEEIASRQPKPTGTTDNA